MTMATAVAHEILRAGVDDWVPLLAIEGMARLQGSRSETESREAALSALKELAISGLVSIGEVSDGGFFPWDEPVEDAIARVCQPCRGRFVAQ
jgi:hypothetical protein